MATCKILLGPVSSVAVIYHSSMGATSDMEWQPLHFFLCKKTRQTNHMQSSPQAGQNLAAFSIMKRLSRDKDLLTISCWDSNEITLSEFTDYKFILNKGQAVKFLC